MLLLMPRFTDAKIFEWPKTSNTFVSYVRNQFVRIYVLGKI